MKCDVLLSQLSSVKSSFVVKSRNFFLICCLVASSLTSASATTVLYHRLDGDAGASNSSTATAISDSSISANHSNSVSGSPVYSNDVFGSPVPQTGASNGLSLDLERDSAQRYSVADSASLDFGAGSDHNSLGLLLGNRTSWSGYYSTLKITDTSNLHSVSVRFDDTTDTATCDGRIDELRISNTSLADTALLHVIPEPSTVALLGVGLLGPCWCFDGALEWRHHRPVAYRFTGC